VSEINEGKFKVGGEWVAVKLQFDPHRTDRRNKAGLTNSKVPVTMRALIQRINRKLARSEPGWCEQIKKSRSARSIEHLGEYYVFDTTRGMITDREIDPEDWARKLGVLKPHEEVVSGK